MKKYIEQNVCNCILTLYLPLTSTFDLETVSLDPARAPTDFLFAKMYTRNIHFVLKTV